MTQCCAELVSGISNRDFLERYAAPGRIGLSGGTTLIDRAISRAQRHLDAAKKWSDWSHTFIFEGRRIDGEHWVIESDVQFHRRHTQLGVQENRLSKYCNQKLYSTLAVLDVGLDEIQTAGLLKEALSLVAEHARYSMRELFGTLLALRHPKLRPADNVLAQERAMYCSAFVQHLFRKVGLDLSAGVALKNTTPEDIARTPLARSIWIWKPAPAIKDPAKTLSARDLPNRLRKRIKRS
jgi:hypothetical protein